MRLKRRLFALEEQLSKARASKQQHELQALSVRRRALSEMLNARKLLLTADGGNETLYRQAMDAASGGA